MRKALAQRLEVPAAEVWLLLCVERTDGLTDYWFLVGGTIYRCWGEFEYEDAEFSSDLLVASQLVGVISLQFTYPEARTVYCGFVEGNDRKRAYYFKMGNLVVAIEFPLQIEFAGGELPKTLHYPGS